MQNIFPPFLISIVCVLSLCSCQKRMTDACCAPATLAKNKSTVLTCKLSTKELQDRKMTVVASLKKQMLDRKELSNGYAFKFGGSDNVLNELTEFIKSERECCDFFTFNLSISGDKSEIWLELTGVEGAKDFITTELQF